MKTSNKILLVGILLLTITILCTSYYHKLKAIEGMLKGSGNIVERKIDVSSFNKVRLENVDFELIHGSEERIELIVDDNLADKYTAVVNDDGLLIIKREEGIFISSGKAKAKIYYNNIYAIRSYSGKGSGNLTGDSLFVYFTQGSDGAFTLDSKETTIHCSSGAELTLKGTTRNMVITGGAGGAIEAKELKAETCSVNIGSGTSVEVYVTELLKGNVSSGAELEYYGNTKNVQLESSSGGSIKRLGTE